MSNYTVKPTQAKRKPSPTEVAAEAFDKVFRRGLGTLDWCDMWPAGVTGDVTALRLTVIRLMVEFAERERKKNAKA